MTSTRHGTAGDDDRTLTARSLSGGVLPLGCGRPATRARQGGRPDGTRARRTGAPYPVFDDLTDRMLRSSP
jgi:hypothetical protein